MKNRQNDKIQQHFFQTNAQIMQLAKYIKV